MTDEKATVNEASEPVIDSGTAPAADPVVSNDTSQVIPGYVSQQQVNGIAADARRKAYDKGQNEATTSLKQEMAELRGMIEKSSSKTAQKESNQTFNKADLEGMLDSRLAEREQQANARHQEAQATQAWQQMSSELLTKVNEAQKKHSDYDDTVNKVNYYDTAPELLFLANRVDNGGEVLYQLAADPSKLANFKTVARETPHLVERLMKKYAASLKNQGNTTTSLPPDPLSQLSPSNVGGDDGKLETVDDFRRKYTV